MWNAKRACSAQPAQMCRLVIAGTVYQDKYQKAKSAGHDWSEHMRLQFDTDIKGDT